MLQERASLQIHLYILNIFILSLIMYQFNYKKRTRTKIFLLNILVECERLFFRSISFSLIHFSLSRKKWRQCNRWCDLRIVFRSRNSRPSTIRERIPVRVIRWNLNVLNVHPAKGRKNPPNIFERLPPLEDGSFLCTCDNLSRSRE